jgi:hypothetical protein
MVHKTLTYVLDRVHCRWIPEWLTDQARDALPHVGNVVMTACVVTRLAFGPVAPPALASAPPPHPATPSPDVTLPAAPPSQESTGQPGRWSTPDQSPTGSAFYWPPDILPQNDDTAAHPENDAITPATGIIDAATLPAGLPASIVSSTASVNVPEPPAMAVMVIAAFVLGRLSKNKKNHQH